VAIEPCLGNASNSLDAMNFFYFVLFSISIAIVFSKNFCFSASFQNQYLTENKTMKYVLVTGANRGLGLGICREILKRDESLGVILGTRDQMKGLSAVESLKTENVMWEERIRHVSMDVADEESVRGAASSLAIDEVKLHAIINNAAVGIDLAWSGPPTADVARATLSTNFWGVVNVVKHFRALLDINDGSGRIINITSGAGQTNMCKMSSERRDEFLKDGLTLDELSCLVENFCQTYEQNVGVVELPALVNGWWLQAYGFSKACLNMLTRIQAQSFPEVQVNCCTPGFVATDMVVGYVGNTKLKSVEEGTKTPVWLCLEGPGSSGLLFGNDLRQLNYEDEYV